MQNVRPQQPNSDPTQMELNIVDGENYNFIYCFSCFIIHHIFMGWPHLALCTNINMYVNEHW